MMLKKMMIENLLYSDSRGLQRADLRGRTEAKRGKALRTQTALAAHSGPREMLAQCMGVLASATVCDEVYSAIAKSSSLELGHLDSIPATFLTTLCD